jgi:hypothetical protein
VVERYGLPRGNDVSELDTPGLGASA